MQRRIVAGILSLFLTAFASAENKSPRHAKFPRWITDYAAARAIARADGKPMLVVLRCEP